MSKEFVRRIFEDYSHQYNVNPARTVVWEAFSQLYLDTSLSREELEKIAVTLSESPYSAYELQHIFAQEVTPVCSSNLGFLPGEWGYFDPHTLIPKCKEQQTRFPYQEVFDKTKLLPELSFIEKLLGKKPIFSHSKLIRRAEEIREDVIPDPSIARLEIMASIEHYSTEFCGRTLPLREQFNCPMVIRGRYNDCRIYFEENVSLLPGAKLDSVKIGFLCPDLVYPKISVGGIYHLWERTFIGEIEVDSIEVTKK